MKNVFLILVLAISSFVCAQNTDYFRQLRYNHVSPYIDIVGIHPLDSLTASTTSHYIFKSDKYNRLVEIINHHYHTEKVHPLASLGVYKVVFNYEDGKEIRTFYDPNSKRIANDRNVYKEVYLLDKKGLRYQLNFYDLEDNPMESNWKITEYQWEKSKRFIVEKRYNLNKDLVPVSPYFKFGITGILLDKKGAPKGHYNLNSTLAITENEDGLASYQDTFDDKGNHIKYTYHNKDNNLVMNQWNFAAGEKKYDVLGNFIELELLDETGNTIVIRNIPSNVSIKISPIATRQDSLDIKERSIGYLEALQQLKPDLMDTVLNDSLNKITIDYDRNSQKQYGRATSKKQMIAFANSWNKSGTKFPLHPKQDITILDIYNRIANVKIVSDNWVEYLQLIKLEGKWEIMNIIWQYRDVGFYRD
ncbi:nuclear transport factor 2 family protein [Bizionia psychrotolerans]|uniref:nuclear transport factor 2 family protein n=1 Tax=Bizionia psychrotolerans TaxID=1492901 RepID=UPI0006520832|nr:nuclear transport factor 2 family protein [Bizionia psychrotolerans]